MTLMDSRAKACLTVIRRLAESKNLSSAFLAEKVDIPVDQFRQFFVDGSMPLNVFMSVCNGLGTTVTDVLLNARKVLAEETDKKTQNSTSNAKTKTVQANNTTNNAQTKPETSTKAETPKVDPWSMVDDSMDNPFTTPEDSVNAGTPFNEANSVSGLSASDRLFVNWSNIIQTAIKTCEVSESLQNNLPKPKTTETDDTINLEFNSEQDLTDYSNSGLEAAVNTELAKNNIDAKIVKIVAK